MKLRYPHIKQHDEADCGAACLSMVAEFYGAKYPMSLVQNLVRITTQGTNFYSIIKGAKEIGLKGEALEGTMCEFVNGVNDGEVKLPSIARIINELGLEHFVVVYKIGKTYVTIGDPAKSSLSKMEYEKFKQQWQGQIASFEPLETFFRVNKRKELFLNVFHYVSGIKKYFVYIFLLSVFIALANMFGSVVFQYVIENVMNTNLSDGHLTAISMNESDFMTLLKRMEKQFETVFKNIDTVCIAVIVMYLFKHILELLRSYIIASTSKKIDNDLTMSFYNHLVFLPSDFYDRRRTGDVMSRFYDIGRIRGIITTAVLTVLLDTVMATGCGIVLVMINPLLFVITMIIVLLYTFIMMIFKKPIKHLNHDLMEKGAEITSYLKESIQGSELIKAYNYEKNAQERMKQLYHKFTDKNQETIMINTIVDVVVSFLQSVGIVILLWFGSWLCIKNIISITDLIMFYYLLDYFLEPIESLVHLQPELQMAMVVADRLNDIFDVSLEGDNKADLKMPVEQLAVEDITFGYGGGKTVLRNVSMKFRKGQRIAIIGESGCGKTTIAKMLMGFHAPEKGSVTINSENMQMFSLKSIRKKIAYVSQNTFFFSDTIYNNLRMGDESITDAMIRRVCEMCCAEKFIRLLPFGYNTVLRENGDSLSNGQKQRLSIARALLRNPDVIIFDEPTSSMDVATEKSIVGLINKFANDRILIVITHRLETIKNYDNIYLMKGGMVVKEGSSTINYG